MTSQSAQDTPLGDLTEQLLEKAGSDEVSVRDMMDAAGNAAYGPLLLLIALITITPIGSIPGASIIAGIVLIMLGGQMLISRGSLWMPSWIERRSVKSERIKKALSKSRPYLDKVDQLPRPRLQSLLQKPWTQAVAVGVIVMGLLMFPLAFVPWGVLAPGVALLVVGLGLMGKDGLLTALGLVAMTIAAGFSIYLAVKTF